MRRSRLYLSGIRLMTLSAVAFALMALCVKIATVSIPPVQIVFFRSFFGMLLVLPIIFKKKIPLWGQEKIKLIVRGVSGFLALILHFYTISKLGLGLAVTLNYISPIFAVIGAFFFLNEKPSLLVWGLILLSLVGVLLLNPAPLPAWQPEIWLALLSSVFAAIAYITIRTIKHRESPLTIIFYFTMIATIGSIFFLRHWVWPDLYGWLLIAGVVVFSFYGQLWMTTALRRAPPYLVTPFQYLHPVISFGFGWLLWRDAITPEMALGIFLIILSGSLISFFETRVRDSQKIPTPPSKASL